MKFTLKLISITAMFSLVSHTLLEKFGMLLFPEFDDLRLLLLLIYFFTQMKYGDLRIKEQDQQIESLRSELKNSHH